MSFIRGGETVVIKRKVNTGDFDDYKQPIFTTRSYTIRECLIAFGSSDEPVENDRDPIDRSLTLYLPPGTVVEPGDVFHLRATDFVRDGAPEAWISPFDQMPAGVVIKVRRRDA